MAKKKATKPKEDKAAATAAVVVAVDNTTAPRIRSAKKTHSHEFSMTEGSGGSKRASVVQADLIESSKMRRTNPRPGTFIPASMVRQKFLPMQHFLLQWHADTYGFPECGLVQLIGDPGCGKSTKVLMDMAHLMHERDTPALYLACEGESKTMSRDRMLRCMHTNPDIAYKLLSGLTIDYVQSVVQLQHKMLTWAKAQRNGASAGSSKVAGVPMSISLQIAIDPYSRLLSGDEAEGVILWDQVSKEKLHEVNTGSNFGHSKFAHAFARWLQAFCDTYNVLLHVVHQRTEKVDFGAAKSTYNQPDWKKRLLEYRYLGGNALDGLAALVTIMTSTETVYDKASKITVGRKVHARVCKQSHGAAERYCEWDLRMVHDGRDRDNYLDPPLSFSRGLCRMLQDTKRLGLKIDDETGLVTIGDLDLRGLSPEMADMIIHRDQDLLTKLGEDMKISGYYSLVDQIIKRARDTQSGKTVEAPAPVETSPTTPDAEATKSTKKRARKRG